MKIIVAVIYLYSGGLSGPMLTVTILTNAQTVSECEEEFLPLMDMVGEYKDSVRVACEEHAIAIPS